MIFRLNNRGKIIAILAPNAEQDFSLLRGFDFLSLVDDGDRQLALKLIATEGENIESAPVELRLKLSTTGSSRYRVTASKDTDLFLLAVPLEQNAVTMESDQTLDSSKQRARLLFDKLPLALLVVSKTGIIQAGNTVACSMFQYSASQLGALSIDRLVKQDNSELELIDFLKHMLGRTFRATGLKNHDLSFPIEVHTQFLDETGEVLLLSVFDITKQEELERFKRDLIKVLRHGIRGPLTSLRLFLGTLKKGFYKDKPSERLEERATLMFDETSKLIDLTTNLLAFESFDNDPAKFDWTLIPTGDLIRHCIEKLSDQIEIVWQEEELPRGSILSNEDRLKKAFCDLIRAIASYSNQTVAIGFETRHAKLTIVVSGKLPSDQQDSAEADDVLLSLSMAKAQTEACGAEVELIRDPLAGDKVLVTFMTN